MQVEPKSIAVCTLWGDINYKIFLPDLQRPFVWLDRPADKKIEYLFDSILKGYPIGNLLIWKIKKDDAKKWNMQLEQFQREYNTSNSTNKPQKIDALQNDEILLVLDGQQRLTALCIGFNGSVTKTTRSKRQITKELYINLAKTPNLDDTEDRYELEFLTQEEASSKGASWFKCKDIKEMEQGVIWMGRAENEAKILARLATIYKEIEGFRISTLELSDATPNQAVEIFSRVNSKGKVLQKTDILLSFITVHSSKFDMKKQINELVKDWQIDFKDFATDKFLSICMLLTNEAGEAKYKVEDFTKERVTQIINHWEKITKSVTRAIDKLKELGYGKYAIYTNIIGCLSYYYYLNDNKQKIQEDDYILTFIQRMQLTGFFASSTSSQLTKIAKSLQKYKSFKGVLEDKELEKDLKISADKIAEIIDKAEYGQGSTLAILQLLFAKTNYENEKYHIDHIYPRKSSGGATYKNKLFNLEILTIQENENKKNKEPQKWLEEAYPTLEAQENFKRLHYWPDVPATNDNMEAFKEARNALLIEALIKKCTN